MTRSAAEPGTTGTGEVTIAVGGHESDGGRALAGLLGTCGALPAAGGRDLDRAVGAALRQGARRVCVLPMTLGRDHALVADAARTLAWLARDHPGRLALARPFGTPEHLAGWVRAAVGRAEASSAVLVVAPAAAPDEDADLFRVARLARQYGTHALVEVAFLGGDPDLDAGITRCRRLGADQVTVVPASFVHPAVPHAPGVRDGGRLLTPAAVGGVVHDRSAAALRRLAARSGDGLAEVLTGHQHRHTHPRHATPA